MAIVQEIQSAVSGALSQLFHLEVQPGDILVNETKPEFAGDYTVVLFALLKSSGLKPEAAGNELGRQLISSHPRLFSGYNVIKGFLNLSGTDEYWANFLQQHSRSTNFGFHNHKGSRVMVEYSSPNTNKPLHLGHLRNNFLGWSIAAIYQANGYHIAKTCIANDRGIHICKSMVAWKRFANGATPESTGLKGDHLVGDYYVMFGIEHKKEVQHLVELGMPREEAEREAPIMKEAQQMLVDWEAGDKAVIDLWKTMNTWVYRGFDETYKRIGTDFDKVYYESDTYLLGKKMVEDGLRKGVFYTKDDGSVWIDLTADGLDEKIVRRRDGTSVYMTQDIGLAELKQEEFHADLSIYVVGDEQNYHFKVLKLIAQKLGLPSADGIYHLSYGMVELPTGRMKTREGTVVDADDIIDEMVKVAREKTTELGKVQDFSEPELNELVEMIGLGALKFFLLRVDPKKRMLFNPEESIDFHGFTGPFVQYTHARIQSILRKEQPAFSRVATTLLPLERKLILVLEKFGDVLRQALDEMNPSLLANYVYQVAKLYNTFYNEHSVLQAESADKKELRLQLSQMTVNVIKSAMGLMGIRVPERM